MSLRAILFAGLVPLGFTWSPPGSPPPRVAVLSIALNDLSNQPASPELPERMEALSRALRERLSAAAEWVVIPRLNRASPWVTDLQAHVVRASDTAVVSNRIVEVKGIELTPELAARLVDRGAAWMADQLSQAIDHAVAGGQPAARRCPA